MTTSELRRDREALLVELRLAGAKLGASKQLRCPFHEDQTPSGAIYQDPAGVWRFKCHTAACGVGGDVFDLQARRLGISVDDVLRNQPDAMKPQGPLKAFRMPKAERSPSTPSPTIGESKKSRGEPSRSFVELPQLTANIKGEVQSVFEYQDRAGTSIMAAVRYIPPGQEKKSFLQVKRTAEGWSYRAGPKPWPLFRLPEVLKAESVIVVEGEKCAEALRSLGFVATTSLSGAANPQHTDWTPLGGKIVTIWIDNDPSGAAYGRAVLELLGKAPFPPKEIRFVDLQGLADLEGWREHADAADLIEAGHIQLARLLVETAEPVPKETPASGVVELFEDIIAGKRKAIAWPWPMLGLLTKALAPEALTVLCGGPGDGKSLLLLQAALHWRGAGVPVRLLCLEELLAFHQRRALAMLTGNARLTDDQWCQEHPEKVREALAQHQSTLDDIGAVLDCPKDPMSLSDAAQWAEAQAHQGARVIGIDPVTMLGVGPKRWLEDDGFVSNLKGIAEQYGCSIVLITHYGKHAQGDTLDDVAGGSAYGRFTSTVTTLRRRDNHEYAQVVAAMGTVETPCTHSLRIAKARNSTGAGQALAFDFDPESLTFRELGILVQKAKRSKRTA